MLCWKGVQPDMEAATAAFDTVLSFKRETNVFRTDQETMAGMLPAVLLHKCLKHDTGSHPVQLP
jgi:hypothetical protein